jgi:hypothetical protein
MEGPRPRDALERRRFDRLAHDIVAHDEVVDRRSDQHLRRRRERHDPGADMRGDAPEASVYLLELARVEATAYVEAEHLDVVGDGRRSADAPGRSVEGGEESVSGGVLLAAVMALQLLADRLAKEPEADPPSAVPHL